MILMRRVCVLGVSAVIASYALFASGEAVEDSSVKLETDQVAAVPAVFAELEKLLEAKDYDAAISRIDEELKKSPGDFRLIGIKSFVQYKYLDDMDGSLATIDAAIAANPKQYDLYDFKIKLYKAAELPDAKERISGVYEAVAENFADQPLQLSDIGFQLLRNSLRDVNLESAILLLRTAKANMGNCTESEKYMILTNLARGYYFASRADLALLEQAEAHTHANELEKLASQQQLDFYLEASELAKKLDRE